MKAIIFLLLVATISGCVNAPLSNESITPLLDKNISDSNYDAYSMSDNYNSGGRFVTSIHFFVNNYTIINGTINKYSNTIGNEINNVTYLLDDKENNELYTEIHTQIDIYNKIIKMLQVKSFVINDMKCFELRNNESIQTIRLDAYVCFDNNYISVYSERSDSGRGGFYYWYKKGYKNVSTVLKQLDYN